ncbi:hypothetical protein SEA_WALTZ_4 [Arthrobacter phage Waltz]|nr:hypothetical protein SEA_WALTZ_4 [Arthrobacter phage Waltz]
MPPYMRDHRQYPQYANLHHDSMGRQTAEIELEHLIGSTPTQQANLFMDFDTTVTRPGTREAEDLYGGRWLSDMDLRQRISIRHEEPMSWRIPRGMPILQAWSAILRNLPARQVNELAQRSDELGYIINRAAGYGSSRRQETAAAEQALMDTLIPRRQSIYDQLRAAENTRHPNLGIRGVTPNQVIFDENISAATSRTPEPQGATMPPEPVQQPWDTMAAAFGSTSNAVADIAAQAAQWSTGPTRSSEVSRAGRVSLNAPIIPLADGETRYFPHEKHLHPEPLARVTSANKFKALTDSPDYISNDVARMAGIPTILFAGEDVPSKDALRDVAAKTRLWLEDVYGLHLSADAIMTVQAVTVARGRAALAAERRKVVQVRNEQHEVQRKLDRRIREVNRLLEENRRLEERLEGPQPTPEQAAKAVKWDELVTVAAEWDETPQTDARTRVGKFRHLVHSLKVAAGQAPAPAVAPPVIDEAPLTREQMEMTDAQWSAMNQRREAEGRPVLHRFIREDGTVTATTSYDDAVRAREAAPQTRRRTRPMVDFTLSA